MGDRLQRILQRQQALEAKMKETESKNMQNSMAQAKKNFEERKTVFEKLQNNNNEWHQEDLMIKGYCGADRPGAAVIKASDQEVKEREAHITQQNTDGAPVGLQWIRTAYGWQRGLEPSHSYKAPCSPTSLPSWLYTELDVRFGLRRVATADFAEACTILKHLYDTYAGSEDTSTSVRRSILNDLAYAISRLLKCPGITRLYKNYIEAANLLMPIRDKLLNDKSYGHSLDFLHDIEANNATSLSPDSVVDSVGICDIVPAEVLLYIFSFLDHPRDLCGASSVCFLWGVLASDESLYQSLLNKRFPHIYAAQNFRDAFINAWVCKSHVGTGLMKCSRCKRLNWAANRNSICTATGQTWYGIGEAIRYGHRQEKVNTNKIVDVLIGRVKYY